MTLSRMTKVVGKKGFYLTFFRKIKKDPIPISVPIFGKIRTYHEIRNLHGNFAVGELRDRKIEKYLKGKSEPCIVDCGVNVGITVRWWFYLNETARVYGIDMLSEAQEFTRQSLELCRLVKGNSAKYLYKPITCALYSEDDMKFKVNIDNPLYGNNSLFEDKPSLKQRDVLSRTLDSIFDAEQMSEVDLLKIDIEGAGGQALRGAHKLLNRTKYVIFEIHGEEECKMATKILSENNFLLRRIINRNLWWEKA